MPPVRGFSWAPTGLEDFLRKAQAMIYDSERAMFEAYDKDKYASTGVIHWMLNNPWPSIYWHLYDDYLYPAAGYFADIQGVSAEGPEAVVFHIRAPDATFLPRLAMVTLRPTCKSAGHRYSSAWMPCASMPPHEGSSGGAPAPMKLSEASTTIAYEMLVVTSTM